MVHGLTGWVASAGIDPDVRAVVVTGAGRAFCSGDDIVGGMADDGNDIKAMRRGILDATTRGPHHLLVKTLLSTPKPIVAALNGRCHGAGFVIASACDFRVARDDVLLGDIRSGQGDFRQPRRRATAAAADRPGAGHGSVDDGTRH